MKLKLTLITVVVTLGVFAIFSKPKRINSETVDAIIKKHMQDITPAIEDMIESKNATVK